MSVQHLVVIFVVCCCCFLLISAEDRVFQFKTEDQHRLENWTTHGRSTGFFGWIDANGEGLDIEFIADENGYRVIKKKNDFGFRGRNPRDRQDAEEFEFDAEEDGLADAYSFRYDTGTSFREEAKRGGVVFGKYGFLTSDGRLHVVKYTASRKRGYVPIREVKDASEYASAAAEPISPIPLRRFRALASPPDLWPIDNSVVQPTTFIDSTTIKNPVTNFLSNVTRSPIKILHVASSTQAQRPKPVNLQITTKINRGSRAQVDGRRQFSYNLGRQFHKQDQIGNDSVSGKYGWRDASGVLRTVHYLADKTGFKILNKDVSN